MPTPTVDRSRSPVSISTPSRFTTTPITIPVADTSDLASKLPSQDTQNAHTHGIVSISSESEHRADNDSDSDSVTTSTHDNASTLTTGSPPQAAHLLAATPPPTTCPIAQQSQPKPQKHAMGDLPPSLEPRHWEVAPERIRPSVTSSFLRPYSRFVGTQRSDKATYKVEVELKYVDMARSQLSGFLKIEGLTEHLPTITTYFEGEIIGTRHTLLTEHSSWGATHKTDIAHWQRFPQFNPATDVAEKQRGRIHEPSMAQRRNIYMRWKEQFLVPDHQRTDLPGASFEGFYYIIFDQVTGCIHGIYFHAKSEKYQRLELDFVGTSEMKRDVKERTKEERKELHERGLGLRQFAPPAIEFR